MIQEDGYPIKATAPFFIKCKIDGKPYYKYPFRTYEEASRVCDYSAGEFVVSFDANGTQIGIEVDTDRWLRAQGMVRVQRDGFIAFVKISELTQDSKILPFSDEKVEISS